jgi:hypothetical protein
MCTYVEIEMKRASEREREIDAAENDDSEGSDDE